MAPLIVVCVIILVWLVLDIWKWRRRSKQINAMIHKLQGGDGE